MIKVTLTNEILRYITEIEQNRYKVSSVKLSSTVMNRLRKNSKKKSSYASNKIEGNPLSEKQVDEVIESGKGGFQRKNWTQRTYATGSLICCV